MLKRAPSLSEQVKSHLKQQIVNEEFAAGRIPSETELAEALGVSRTTVRDALGRLESEGVIFRKQGAGTFVNKPGLQIKTRLEEMWSYAAVLEAHGYTPSTQILSVQRQPAAADVAADLELAGDVEMVVVHKLFLEDDQPVILTENQIPAHLIQTPFQDDDFCLPVYLFLGEYCRQRLAYYLSDIVPILAAPEIAGPLHLPVDTPLISFAETGYNEDNQPILKAHSYFRDDLLRLRLIRRQV